MEHSGVYRNTENKTTKRKFGCFNPVGGNKPKDSKFTYMAKSYVISINNAREPNAAPRSLFNMEFMSKISKKESEVVEAPKQRPVESVKPASSVPVNTPAPAPAANIFQNQPPFVKTGYQGRNFDPNHANQFSNNT